MSHLFRTLAVTAALVMVPAACTGGNDTDRGAGARVPDDRANADPETDILTVYSRRDAGDPLFDLFEQQTGTTIRVRFGNPIDLGDC